MLICFFICKYNQVNKHIKVVLCEPSHPGNIGATARAIKNMGLSRLVLVAPERFPHQEAFDRASGADDVLHAAEIYPDLSTALANVQWVFGTSSRQREFPWPLLTAREAGEKIAAFDKNQEIAIVFGTERSGLSNEQLQLCDFHITIPANEAYPSLNLSQAVQIITYEVFMAHAATQNAYLPRLDRGIQSLDPANKSREVDSINFQKASRFEIEGLITHFEQVATQIGFYVPSNPKRLFPRLRRLFAKAQLEQDEVNILRGFLKLVKS